MQTTEQRLERLEKHNRRLTAALTLMVVAMCAVVTVAATDETLKDGHFDTLTARTVLARSVGVINEDGKLVVQLGSAFGAGKIETQTGDGKTLVQLTS